MNTDWSYRKHAALIPANNTILLTVPLKSNGNIYFVFYITKTQLDPLISTKTTKISNDLSTNGAWCHALLYVAILRDPRHHRWTTGLVPWLSFSQKLSTTAAWHKAQHLHLIGRSTFFCSWFLKVFTLTTTQLQPTTLRGLPSRSILHRPTHSPSFLLSSTWNTSYTEWMSATDFKQCKQHWQLLMN